MPEFYMIARQLQIFSRFWGEIGLKGVMCPPTIAYTPHPSTSLTDGQTDNDKINTTSPAMFLVWYVYMFLTDRSGPYNVIDDSIT